VNYYYLDFPAELQDLLSQDISIVSGLFAEMNCAYFASEKTIYFWLFSPELQHQNDINLYFNPVRKKAI
jgi:hypothetical protein